MARFTTAYYDFRSGLIEIATLCRIAAQKERQDPIRFRDEINGICRGTLVLLSAHLEAYIKNLGEKTLDALHTSGVSRQHLNGAIFYHFSKDLLEEVSDTREPNKVAEKVFGFLASDAPFWSRSGPFPQPPPSERFNKGFSNPAYEKIRTYFNRFGYTTYSSDMANRLKADFNTTKNMVNHLVDTRNKIAHGDRSVTKTSRDITDMTAILRKYGKTTDDVFAAWCKKNLCRIR